MMAYPVSGSRERAGRSPWRFVKSWSSDSCVTQMVHCLDSKDLVKMSFPIFRKFSGVLKSNRYLKMPLYRDNLVSYSLRAGRLHLLLTWTVSDHSWLPHTLAK
ncbi:hypothetical protein F2P79_000554 [Pimephales promelas]|nr:hypothetical protein F2P79_000554 [Pimephales promelas]